MKIALIELIITCPGCETLSRLSVTENELRGAVNNAETARRGVGDKFIADSHASPGPGAGCPSSHAAHSCDAIFLSILRGIWLAGWPVPKPCCQGPGRQHQVQRTLPVHRQSIVGTPWWLAGIGRLPHAGSICLFVTVSDGGLIHHDEWFAFNDSSEATWKQCILDSAGASNLGCNTAHHCRRKLELLYTFRTFILQLLWKLSEVRTCVNEAHVSARCGTKPPFSQPGAQGRCSGLREVVIKSKDMWSGASGKQTHNA